MKDFFNIDITQFSVLNFVGLIALGLLLYGFLWVLKNYLVLILIKSPVRRKKISEKLPPLSALIWILFAAYSLYLMIIPFPFLGILLVLIFMYFSRGYLINLVHGLFFRLKGDINIGQEIAFGDYQGTVLTMSNFDFEIQNKEGEITQIPYSVMVNKEVTKKDFSSDFTSYKFSIQTTSEISENELRIKLLQSPWITPVFPATINRVSSEGNHVMYDIIVYAIDEKYHSLIERNLKLELLEK